MHVTAVIVAYNRADLLHECLNAIATQTRQPDAVIVIDNASCDHTPQVIAAHPIISDTLRIPFNTGGAGGFAAGIARALRSATDYVWIMDDDTIPQPGALAALIEKIEQYPGDVALAASRAIWHDGRTHPMNTHRERPLISPRLRSHARAIGVKHVRAASFVSILIEARQAHIVGLPEADYFIWNDDLEYTARLLRHRVGIDVPDSVVVHKTRNFASATDDPGERFFYEVRNKIWFLHSAGLGPLDRILYGGSMLLRWVRMAKASTNRTVLVKAGWKACKEGVTRKPRPVPEIFYGTAAYTDVYMCEAQAQGRPLGTTPQSGGQK